MPDSRLLLIEDEPEVLKCLERIAQRKRLGTLSANTGEKALQILSKHPVDGIVLDIGLPDRDGLELFRPLQLLAPQAEIIFITGSAKIEDAVHALKLGAFDYLVKPFSSLEQVENCLVQAIEKGRLKRKFSDPEQNPKRGDDLIGQSRGMREVQQTIQSLQDSNASALILGESGTGKELVARAIHRKSGRKDKPFVVINCSAIPETLMESELFGHVRGAFTGATQDKRGLFEEADGGTVFLDEIGEIPPSIQVKLLRVLQEREVRPVGGNQIRRVDVRIVAATHQNLPALIQKGLFREDLYYRLNVISIPLPPLRERKEDIAELAYFFLRQFARKNRKAIREFSHDALQVLQSYSWPGNVRELENTVERSVVLCTDCIIRAKDLPPKLLGKYCFLHLSEETEFLELSYKQAKEKALTFFNRSYFKYLLEKANGNISQASLTAGIDRSNLKKILKKYRIGLKEFQ